MGHQTGGALNLASPATVGFVNPVLLAEVPSSVFSSPEVWDMTHPGALPLVSCRKALHQPLQKYK